MNQLAIVNQSTGELVQADAWTAAREKMIRDNYVGQAPAEMIDAYIHMCKHRGLSPEEKQVYLIKRGDKWSIETSIDGYRAIADRTGLYAGGDAPVFTYDDKGQLESATVTVYKMVQGVRCAFTSTAYIAEFKTSGPTWSKMPRVMLAKCAESQALRRAFPVQTGGIYTADEMDQADPTQPGGPGRAVVREMTHGATPTPNVAPSPPESSESGPPAEGYRLTPDRKAIRDRLMALADELGMEPNEVTSALGAPFKMTDTKQALKVEQNLKRMRDDRQLTDERTRLLTIAAELDLPEENLEAVCQEDYGHGLSETTLDEVLELIAGLTATDDGEMTDAQYIEAKARE
jgi:phage recombination protein Bet